MKKSLWQPIIIFVLFIAVCYLGYGLWQKSKELEIVQDRLENPDKTSVPLDAKIIARRVDEKGLNHAIIEDSKPIRDLIELKVEDRAKVDSLLAVVGIKENQLKSIEIEKARVVHENTILKREINNSTRDTAFVYKDNWWDIRVRNVSDTTKSLNLLYDFDFNSVTYDPRPVLKRFFTLPVTYTDIWSTDKRAQIRGVERLTLRPPVDNFSLNIYATGQYHVNTFGLGGKLQVRVGRITGNGSYLYYPEFNEWKPSIGMDYQIGGF